MSKLRRTLVVVVTLVLIVWAGLRIQKKFVRPPIPAGFSSVKSPDGTVEGIYEERNYSEIEPTLFMGGYLSNPPCGAEAVLNLCEFEDRYTAEHHRWTPINDSSPAPSLEWLRENVEFVAEQQRMKRTTYVHCFAGVSRAGMVMTAYLMRKNHWSRDEALEFIRKARPIVSPNPAFMELLKEWESR